MSRFPCGKYGRQQLQFHPAPFRAPLRAFASLVFPWQGDQVLICDIEDRGWCIPSGRVEPNECSQAAARREAHEEAGAILGEMVYIGCYCIREGSNIRWADLYAAEVDALEPLNPEFESTDRKYAEVEELPDIYHLWNDLTEAVFMHSKQCIERHLRIIKSA